jgi:hypothetical protein
VESCSPWGSHSRELARERMSLAVYEQRLDTGFTPSGVKVVKKFTKNAAWEQAKARQCNRWLDAQGEISPV